jgi:serine protease Do
MTSRQARVGWITALMAGSFLVGSLVAPRIRIEWEPGKLPSQAFAQPPKAAGSPVIPPEEPIARAVAQISGSVVNIDTQRRVVQEDLFYGPQVYRAQGSGSGVVVDSKGHVITNEHVVQGAETIRVTFGNGRSYSGQVRGVDRETDVALVQIRNASSLPVAKLGDSRQLIPGQWAIAIGSPYGYQQTVTLGVVGHTGRAVQVEDRLYKELIQTDAAINPGNSGGPLADIQGRVIGINTIVRSDAQGIGFAIPINLAKRITDEILAHGRVKRPWTGLNIQDVTPEIANFLDLRRVEGCYVDRLARSSPAFRAGVRPGDLVIEVNGKRVSSRSEADAILARVKIGDKVSIVVDRREEAGFRRLRGEIEVAEKP